MHRENEATRQQTNGRLTLASSDIALPPDRAVSTSTASDYLSISITTNSEQSTNDWPRRTYIKFKKTDRARNADTCDENHAEECETRNAEQAEKTFRKSVNNASDIFIRTGRIPHFQPTLPASAKLPDDERDRKCRLNPVEETLNDVNK